MTKTVAGPVAIIARHVLSHKAGERARPFPRSLSVDSAGTCSLVAPVPARSGGDTLASLALAQFRQDWPALAQRLDGMRAKA